MDHSLDFRPAAAWAAAYGPFPDAYLAWDCETTGIDHTTDYPVQIGWCTVRDRATVDNLDYVIDWPTYLPADQLPAFTRRLENTRRKMAERGDDYPWTLDMMKGRGTTPRRALLAFLAAATEPPASVAHNGWGFDYPLIGRVIEAVGLDPWEPPVNSLWDTALLVKACQTGTVPRPREPVTEFVRRVHAARPNGKYSLKACVDLFNLRAVGVDPTAQHTSAYDSWIVFLVFERIRQGVAALAGGR